LEALVIPQTLDSEAQREAEVIFGGNLEIARAPNPEKPGSSLVLVTRGESIDLPEPERIPVERSKKKRNQGILEVSEDVSPKNSVAPGCLSNLR
jgi:hypothetical protein